MNIDLINLIDNGDLVRISSNLIIERFFNKLSVMLISVSLSHIFYCQFDKKN